MLPGFLLINYFIKIDIFSLAFLLHIKENQTVRASQFAFNCKTTHYKILL